MSEIQIKYYPFPGHIYSHPSILDGTIESYKRLAEVWQAGAWGFTIGSALFDKKFVPDGSFLENTLAVCSWLEKTNLSELGNYLHYQEKIE